jgi:predicted GIY-YIG superfamily endonuclease
MTSVALTQDPAASQEGSRRAAVYRLYDAEGTLLYIGASYNPDRRCEEHMRKPWGSQIARRAEEWHPSREDAFAAERRAIWEEGPRHNRASTPEYAELKRKQAAETLGKWRVAYEANELRHRIVRQLERFGYSWNRAIGEGMIVERAYKELSGAFPNGVVYPSLEQINERLESQDG